MYGQEKSVHVRNAHSTYMTYSMCDFSVYGYPHYGKKSILNRNFPPKHFPYLSRIVRKPDFCLGENKGADQLRGNREADQRLCFRYTDSIFPLLLKSEIASF